jgi:FlaA1/EpsC-like NDP-sugar epimerase/protein involved in polysaccharide export with SLBB domain/lipopolysaccharide/colanic/teichoic acid biosynthesis glycosyltransferase
MGLRRTPRFLFLTLGYAALVNLAYVLGLLLRFEGDVPARYWASYARLWPLYTLLTLSVYHVAGLYQGLWRYASTVTLFQILKGVTLSAGVLVGILLFHPDRLFPASLIVLVWGGQLLLVGGVRFAWRLARDRVLGPVPRRAVLTLVVGADTSGIHLIQEMRRRPAGLEALTPVGFIDDDGRLTGHVVEGVKVLGTIADLPRVLTEQRAEMVIVSDPDMPAKVVREIARFCSEANVRIKTLPGLSDLQQGRPALSQMRDVRIEDLLGRQPVHLNLDEVAQELRGERVLVTGAGGSIGSELARQVAEFGPAELVLLDHAENGLYYVHNELMAQHAGLPLHPVVGDIQDAIGLEAAFARYRPTVVFHAAAHKHVPLLEVNPREAILNNVVGTRNLVMAADRHGVRKFVLISTDKAVNPTSVMGASKRVCEMLLQSRSQHSRTQFVAVRFGNVLGSDGSVIPLFRRQLERGGPITVTHPEARRYFMTIHEAVRLVLQAGAMGRGGEVFLLEMGEQVRILDLARQLVRLAGMREGEDVEIVFTGLRPGEKLYEELHSDSERTRITRHERILVWNLDARDEEELLEEVTELEALARSADPDAIKYGLHRLVPEYVEPQHVPYRPAPVTPVVELPAAQPVPARRARGREWQSGLRHSLDTVAAGLLLALSAPLWLLMWLEARRQGEREILVHEVRVGRTRRRGPRRNLETSPQIDRRVSERRTQDLLGQPFACARFRSDLGVMGRWLAGRRLDKVPFLLNVLRHEMTLVGPKPEKEYLVLRWQSVVPDYARRFSVLPGVTGLAQVADCSDADVEGLVRRVHYDLYYVDNRSLLLDVRTLGRTFGVILRRPRPGHSQPTEPAVGRPSWVEPPVRRTRGAPAGAPAGGGSAGHMVGLETSSAPAGTAAGPPAASAASTPPRAGRQRSDPMKRAARGMLRGWVLALMSLACWMAGISTAWAQEYVLGPEDVITISVYLHPELERSVAISVDGNITFPPLGELKAAGLTPKQLGERIADRLSSYLRQTTAVTVTVTQFLSRSVFVTGAVARPGRYGFERIPSLVDVIAQAGGAAPGADLSRVQILRREGAGRRSVTADVAAAMRDGGTATLPELRPGDTVVVPGAPTTGPGAGPVGVTLVGGGVGVLGEVQRPGLYVVGTAQDLWAVLAAAGGLTARGDLSDVRVITRDSGTQAVIKLNLKQSLARGGRGAYMVKDGDVVFVGASGAAQFGRAFAGLQTVLSLSADVLNIVLLRELIAERR